jgi:hypothetical protein
LKKASAHWVVLLLLVACNSEVAATGDAVCGREGGPGAHELECFCSKFPCPSSANDDFCTEPFKPCVAERFDYDACQRIRVKQDTSVGTFHWLFDSTTGELVGARHATDTSEHGPSGETLSESCAETDCKVLCEPSLCTFAKITCTKDAGIDSGP